MTPRGSRDPAELIAHVLDRYHETHRRELPQILQLARELQARGAPPAVADHPDAMAKALESHMFKEEMRLFPMIEQGGNTLIGHLIADMHAEHLEHCEATARLQALLAGLRAPPGAEAEEAALRAAVAKLLDDLAQHMQLEDQILFLLFSPGAAA
jgi:regulator of cell morphogenesis and NO signaling